MSHSLASLVSDVLRGLNLEARLKEQTCVLVWDEVVGEQVAASAQPEFARDGKLFVVTKNPVWANELNLYKRDIIARLNARAGGNVLKDIVFKPGRVASKRRAAKKAQQPEQGLEGIRLTDVEVSEIRATARAIGEKDAASFERLLQTAARLEKWKRSHGWTPCRQCGALQNGASGICPVCEVG